MVTTITTTGTYTSSPVPEAYISVSKGRQKLHGSNVYLNEGAEFEIELFNPTQFPVQAKIALNGTLISQQGLIINPGQRVFLDRFFDVNKTFKFVTYEVEGGNDAVKAAIAKNGLVEIFFYKEKPKPIPDLWWNGNSNIYYTNQQNSPININYTGVDYNADIIGTGGRNNMNYNSDFLDFSLKDAQASTTTANVSNLSGDLKRRSNIKGGNGRLYSRSFDNVDSAPEEKYRGIVTASAAAPKIETGRIEQGSRSNTTFKTVYMDVETFASTTYKYQILPNSQKPVEVAEIVKNYCSNCSSKVKSRWKFCSVCGNKLT